MELRVINADRLILGRLATRVAKMLLRGESVIIVNAEKAVISGRKRFLIDHYKKRQEIRTHTNPVRGPMWPKIPNRFVRRTIRGMLPFKRPRGRDAFRNLKVYTGVPETLNIDASTFETFAEASLDHLKGRFMVISELMRELGWKY